VGARVEGSTLFEGAQVGEGTISRNHIVGLGAIIYGGCIVRGLFVLGAGRIIEEENLLDRGTRVSRARPSKVGISFRGRACTSVGRLTHK
jgi:hypothetical protein